MKKSSIFGDSDRVDGSDCDGKFEISLDSSSKNHCLDVDCCGRLFYQNFLDLSIGQWGCFFCAACEYCCVATLCKAGNCHILIHVKGSLGLRSESKIRVAEKAKPMNDKQPTRGKPIGDKFKHSYQIDGIQKASGPKALTVEWKFAMAFLSCSQFH